MMWTDLKSRKLKLGQGVWVQSGKSHSTVGEITSSGHVD